jgi:hypothetical protein
MYCTQAAVVWVQLLVFVMVFVRPFSKLVVVPEFAPAFPPFLRGRYVPLSIAALFLGAMAPAQRHVQTALFGLFLVANVVLFQPWEVSACVQAERGQHPLPWLWSGMHDPCLLGSTWCGA